MKQLFDFFLHLFLFSIYLYHSFLSFYSCHLSTSPLSQIHSFSIFLQKMTSLPGISTEHHITRYNKTRNKPTYQGWVMQSSRRKGISRAGKMVRDTTPTVRGVPKNYQTDNHSIYAEELAQTLVDSMIAASDFVRPWGLLI